MNKTTQYLTIILMTVLLASTASAFAGGDGTSDDPFQIENVTHLNMTRDNLTAHYVLTMSFSADVSPYNETSGFIPIGNATNPFTGSFDGNGSTISDLFINATTSYAGLFGALNEATITNLTLADVTVLGTSHLGALAGVADTSVVYHVYVTGAVTGTNNNVGGLIGMVNSATALNQSSTDVTVVGVDSVGGLAGQANGNITGSFATGDVSGNDHVGGLIGRLSDGVINSSYATGTVDTTGIRPGGLIGYAQGGMVIDSYATGDVSTVSSPAGGFVGRLDSGAVINRSYALGNVSANINAGGFAGYSEGVISDSYARGNVSAAGQCAGFINQQSTAGASITRSYATGLVSCSPASGFISSFAIAGTLSASFWDNETSAQNESDGGAGVVGLPTLNMTNSFTFVSAGWDLIDVWGHNTSVNDGYPFLRWQDFGSEYPMILFAGGNGTSGNPFQISSCQQLQNMNAILSSHYVLVNDVDCNVEPFNTTPGFEPVGTSGTPFTGSLDGAGFNISNMYINRTATDDVGLLGYIENTIVSNIHIVSGNVTGRDYTGLLVGRSVNSNISDSTSNGVVLGGDPVGGFVGESISSNMINVSSEVIVSGEGDVGGLIGHSVSSTVTNSSTMSNISSIGPNSGGLIGYAHSTMVIGSHSVSNVTSTSNIVGGLIGQARTSSNIVSSYAQGTVTSSSFRIGGLIGELLSSSTVNDSYADVRVDGGIEDVGGLVGRASSSAIYRSYALGNVSGVEALGGLVGSLSSSIVNDSYALGSVNGTDAICGGLVGSNSGTIGTSYSTGLVTCLTNQGGLVGGGVTPVTNSFWDNETSGQNESAGGAGVTGLPTSQMNDVTTFLDAGWDFFDTWAIGSASVNDGYPFLQFQGLAANDLRPTFTSSPSASTTATGATLTWRTANTATNYSVTHNATGANPRVNSTLSSSSRSVEFSNLDASTPYNYSVTVCDVYGFCRVQAGTFTTNTDSGSGSSGSSGAGDVIAPALTEIGVTRTLALDRDLFFTLAGSSNQRTLRLTGLTSDSATFRVSGYSPSLVVGLGSSEEFDVSGNGRFDMRLELIRVEQTTATFRMSRGSGDLVVPVVEEPETTPVVGESTLGSGTSGQEVVDEALVVDEGSSQEDVQEARERGTPWPLVFVLLLVLVALGAFVLLKKP